MITVLAGGDSFVWGSELADCRHGGPMAYSRKTYSALLAQDHNYICAAYPGIGNKEIAQRIMTVIHAVPVHAVMVSWTWPSRDNQLDSDEVILNLRWNLEHFNIPYLFTCADNCIITRHMLYKNWYMFPAGTLAGETTAPRGFYQWAKENNYKCGAESHPLEQAHQDATELLRIKFNELVTQCVQSSTLRNTI